MPLMLCLEVSLPLPFRFGDKPAPSFASLVQYAVYFSRYRDLTGLDNVDT